MSAFEPRRCQRLVVRTGHPGLLVFVTLVAAIFTGGGSLRASGPAVPLSDCPPFEVPNADSRPLDLVYEPELPAVVDGFRDRFGRSWLLYWDATSRTARFLTPRREHSLVAPATLASRDRWPEVETAVREFIVSTALFGNDTDVLARARFQALGGGLLLVFPQTTSDGIAVRGASVRAHVGPSGSLLWVKAYAARGVGDAWQRLGLTREDCLEEEVARQFVSADEEVLESRLEIVFAEGTVDSLLPAWSFDVAEPDGAIVEHLEDAISGEMLASCRAVKHLEGRVLARAAALDDIFAHPEEIESEPQPLGHAVVTTHRGVPKGTTDAEGHFNAAFEFVDFPHGMLAYASSTEDCDFQPENCDGGRPPCYEMFIRPISSAECFGQALGCVPHVFDAVRDCIPDTVIARDPVVQGIFNRTTHPDLNPVEISWWLQVFAQSVRIFELARNSIDALGFEVEPFLPLGIWPLVGRTQTLGFAAWNRGKNRPRIRTSRGVLVDGGQVVPHMPSRVGHEVGHHMVYVLSGSAQYSDVEEAIADVLVAYANENPKIGFQRENNVGPYGFELGAAEQPAGMARLRSQIGGGFWRFLDTLRDTGRRDRAQHVAICWLLANRCADPQDLTFRDGACIVDELLAVNRAISALENESKRDRERVEQSLRRAFDDPAFHRGTRFLRGDPNLDGAVNLTDAVSILLFLFAREEEGAPFHDCADAQDADDSGDVVLTDAVFILRFLFSGTAPLPAPFPACGQDPSGDDPLCCNEEPACAG